MNFGQLKTYVAGYINREPTSFVRNGIDFLGAAINDAKRSALRKHNFLRLKATGFVIASPSGFLLSDTTVEPLSVNPSAATIFVKKVESCWQFETTGLQRIRQIPFILETDLHNIIPVLEDTTTLPVTNPITFKRRVYVRGEKLYCTGFSVGEELMVDVIQDLNDYFDDSDTDFLSRDCTDWMLFKSLMQLNAFLKETERIQVSKALLDQAWDEIMQDDNERAGNHNSANSLD